MLASRVMSVCTICGLEPCTCELRAAVGVLKTQMAAVPIESMDDAMRSLRGVFKGMDAPGPNEVVAILTSPASPFCMNADQLHQLAEQLDAAARGFIVFGGPTRDLVDEATSTSNAPMPSELLTPEQLFAQLADDLSPVVKCVLDAVGVICDANDAIIEEHPQVSQHRAWALDQALRYLTGRRYPGVRALLGTDYNEGVMPDGLRVSDDVSG